MFLFAVATEDRRYKIWAVNCNWNASNGYWNVEANPITNPNEWNAGNQIVSRDSLLFFRFGGSFFKQILPPSTNPKIRPARSTLSI